jgi:hypothetical protein
MMSKKYNRQTLPTAVATAARLGGLLPVASSKRILA